jgi:hypothetical protein
LQRIPAQRRVRYDLYQVGLAVMVQVRCAEPLDVFAGSRAVGDDFARLERAVSIAQINAQLRTGRPGSRKIQLPILVEVTDRNGIEKDRLRQGDGRLVGAIIFMVCGL